MANPVERIETMPNPVDSSHLKIACSCIPGFEKLAVAECNERLGVEADHDVRGRIWFHLPMSELDKLTSLRSVHHYWVVAEEFQNFFEEDLPKEDTLQLLYDLSLRVDFARALEAWRQVMLLSVNSSSSSTCKNVSAKQERNKNINTTHCSSANTTHQNDVNEKTEHINSNSSNSNAIHSKRAGSEELEERELSPPPAKRERVPVEYTTLVPLEAGEGMAYRVTCQRKGKHSFGSMDAAHKIGGALNDKYLWTVDLTNFDVEIVVHIKDRDIAFGVQLTRESQCIRNISHLGPTTLKSNIAYCLLRLADIQTGDIVCDPMCGGGSISLEGSQGFPQSFQFLGENHPEAMSKAGQNFDALEQNDKTTLPYSLAQWDVYHLPLRTECLDSIVSDLPFGKKMGNKERNLFLYPVALQEMARVTRQGGRIVLLTQHKQAMKKALVRCSLLGLEAVYNINMGGMNVSVYVLHRRKIEWHDWHAKELIEREEFHAKHNSVPVATDTAATITLVEDVPVPPMVAT